MAIAKNTPGNKKINRLLCMGAALGKKVNPTGTLGLIQSTRDVRGTLATSWSHFCFPALTFRARQSMNMKKL
jgi:hypothetical protein